MGTILATSRTPDVVREIGERLRTVRLQRNESIEELAREAGVGVNTVRRLEAGRSVGTVYFIRVLRALGRLTALDAFLRTGRDADRTCGAFFEHVSIENDLPAVPFRASRLPRRAPASELHGNVVIPPGRARRAAPL